MKSQRIALGCDHAGFEFKELIKRVLSESGFEVTTHGGRQSVGLDALAWVERACALGAGEILLNSMDADGTRAGYDIGMITAVRAVSKVPLIASGGAGAREGPDLGRTFHRGRHVAGSLGGSEEFSAEGQEAAAVR